MIYDKYKARNLKRNILSKIDVLGSFDFTTCLIALDSLEMKDLEGLNSSKLDLPKMNQRYRKVIPLAIHEYTHFIDSTSTIWGFNHLLMMNDAYLSNDKINRNEKEFYHAKKFHNHLSKIKYPKYYTLIGKLEKKVQWTAYPTVGILFGSEGQITEETIMFLRFTALSGEHIARSPISPVSILEASAMANEILMESNLLKSLNPKDLAVEQVFYLKKLMAVLYDENLTEYSACVHLLSTMQKCTDIIQAFSLVSLITRVVLNCTEEVFDEIIKQNKVKDLFGRTEDINHLKSITDGLLYRNIGVLYYLVVFGLPEKSYLNSERAINGVASSISKLGIDIGFIKKSAITYIDNNIERLIKSDIKSISKLASSAKENFDIIDMMSITLPFDKLNIPKVFLGDGSERLIFPPENNALANFSLDECFDELSDGEEWVNRFSEGCI